MDTGMVKMAEYTNMPEVLANIAEDLQTKITNGELDPFGVEVYHR